MKKVFWINSIIFSGIIYLLSGLTALKAQTVTDIDGNVYNTVTIGTQVWMKENLRTTRYADGTAIPNVPDSAKWAALNVTYKAYCFYNNSSTNANTYGALYNWAAAMKGASSSSSSPSGIQGICPTGWHLPSHAEWTTLIAYLGGYTMAGGKLKETDTTHWQSPNTGATNESSFTALPSGRRFFNGQFMYIRDQGYWWSSTVSADQLVRRPGGKVPGPIIATYPTAWSPAVTSIENSIGDNAYRQKAGLPVRCVCELNFGLLPVVCLDAEAFNLTQGTPAGGTYSGPGIETSPQFDPAVAGVGTHTITYTYTGSSQDTFSATQTITVNTRSEVIFEPIPEVCVDAVAFNLSQGSPAGGTYRGTGITVSPKFDPAKAGVGTHSITYTTIDGCNISATQFITVNAKPEITFEPVPEVCVNAETFNLTQGSPSGGIYFGVGITGSPRFSPAFAGAGTHVITYSYRGENGCIGSTRQFITVNALPEVTFRSIPAVRLDADAFNLTAARPLGGIYSGPGITTSPQFDPAIAGVGLHSITYTYTKSNGCTSFATQTITVFDSTSTGIKENGDKSNSNTILFQNYPNPFSSQTVISYNLIAAVEVNLSIYDLTGRKITTLVEEKQPAGRHDVEWNAEGITPGIYFSELKAGYNRQVMKMIVVK